MHLQCKVPAFSSCSTFESIQQDELSFVCLYVCVYFCTAQSHIIMTTAHRRGMILLLSVQMGFVGRQAYCETLHVSAICISYTDLTYKDPCKTHVVLQKLEGWTSGFPEAK